MKSSNIYFRRFGTILSIVWTNLVLLAWSKRHVWPDFCQDLQVETRSSFLWEIGKDPPSYFFGTIHVPYTRVWDHVPENAKKALSYSDDVLFELDLTDPYTITALTSCQLLPKGENLSEVLPGDLFSRLKRHLEYVKSEMPSWITDDQRGRGLHADYLFKAITGNWERKRPVWVMLMVNSLTKGDIRSRGVPVLDLFLAQEAKRQKKRTGAVEKVHEQCVPLNRLNFSQGIFALDHTLAQQESLREGMTTPLHSTDDLIAHYNCGSLEALLLSQESTQASSLTVPHLSNDSLPPSEAAAAHHIDDYFKEELIVRRNERMGKRVVRILQENPNHSFFFAFGAGHFLGNNSVLDVVRASGFNVNHISPDQKIKKRKRRRGNKGGGLVPKLSILKNFSFPTAGNLRPDQQIDPGFARFLAEKKRGFPKGFLEEEGTTPSPRRPFNDLWVRIEKGHNKANSMKENKEEDESLRIWYGLPQPKKYDKSVPDSGSVRSHNSLHSIALWILTIIIYFNLCLN